MKDTKKMATIAMLIAIQLVLTRFLSVASPLKRISFAFIALALNGALFGPIIAAISAALVDFIGALLFPIGPYFAGFTLTAAIAGLIYGLFLHNREINFKNIIPCIVLVNLVYLVLNTVWIRMLTGNEFNVLLTARAPQAILETFVKSLVLILILPRLKREALRIIK
ncbi:MAG: folate family ECF transporter S component [Tissierellia bacterium]|nr:folate family ECF transporter S component [Tissierellia bacterium]